MLAAEKRLARRFDLCTATTRAEWETLNDYGTQADTDWFPNGVDADFFCPTDSVYEPETISFIGRMDYYPNQECMARFCQQTWPLLKTRRPGMKLLIVGADPLCSHAKTGRYSRGYGNRLGARCAPVHKELCIDGCPFEHCQGYPK